MLHQFTFKNFKSFREEVTLDFLATSIKEHEEDVVNDIFDEKVLKVAAIFGANASGKTNVIQAFDLMRSFVIFSFKENDTVYSRLFNNFDRFKYDHNNEDMEFSVLFSTEEDIFQYGFSLNENMDVSDEFLAVRNKKIKKESYNYIFKMNEGGEYDLIANELIAIKELVKKKTKKTLLLSLLSNLNIPTINIVYRWITDVSIINFGSGIMEMVLSGNNFNGPVKTNLTSIIEDDEKKKKLIEFVQAFDLGISGFKLSDDDSNDIESNGALDIRKRDIYTLHRSTDGKDFIEMPISKESAGTIKMLTLYTYIEKALSNGLPIFIDELDAKLHPLLLRYIIILFHTNQNNAQLIFTTQDVFTLDKENFRRDEIWFVDKNEFGYSDLYSLSSYMCEDDNGEYKKVRNDASYGKDYILGKYKAVPMFREFNIKKKGMK